MKKALVVVLALAVLATAGIVFFNCGGGTSCTNDTKQCSGNIVQTCTNNSWVNGTDCSTTSQTCSSGACITICCNNKPTTVDVTGKVVDFTTQQGVKVALSPVSPLAALTSSNPPHLDDEVSGTDGTFATKCFDVSTVGIGLMILADDQGFDGAAGTYFPTFTGIKAWTLDSEKVCVAGAQVMAIPNTMVGALAGIPGFDAAGKGFAMGVVVDTTGTPVEGATVTTADGVTNLGFYPKADMSGMQAATSAKGLWVIPGFTASPTNITAKKTGLTFPTIPAGTTPGFCLFEPLKAE